jgi:flagellar protein FlaG
MSVEHSAALKMDMTNLSDRTTCVIPFHPRITCIFRQDAPVGGNILPVSPDPSATASNSTASISNVKDYIQSISRNLEFTVDEEVNRVIVVVCNLETQEVIRQIPAETALIMSVA